jgi:hypothetical protein
MEISHQFVLRQDSPRQHHKKEKLAPEAPATQTDIATW